MPDKKLTVDGKNFCETLARSLNGSRPQISLDSARRAAADVQQALLDCYAGKYPDAPTPGQWDNFQISTAEVEGNAFEVLVTLLKDDVPICEIPVGKLSMVKKPVLISRKRQVH